MFDGVLEQLHQLIASSTATTLPLPSLSFSSLHHHHHHHVGSANPSDTMFPSFDPFTSTNSSLKVQPFNQQQSQVQKSSGEKQERDSNSLEIEIERSSSPSSSERNSACWSNDEVLALLRIRSSLDNRFPESTWAHVSMKLEDLGFKRSAEKCKEKFEEEESRYLSNINYNKISHRSFNEFEDFCSNNHGQNPDDHDEKPRAEEEEEVQDKDYQQKKKKKKKDGDFEMLKGICEDVVKKMVAQQEEMHQKLLEDMVKRDGERFAREEAWKKQEIDRVNQKLEIRAHEQAIAGDRQSSLIKFLKSFNIITSSSSSSSTFSSSSSLILAQNPNDHRVQNPSSNLDHPKPPTSQNPNSPKTLVQSSPSMLLSNARDDNIRKRWPRDEVFALINLRCSLHNNGDHHHHHRDQDQKEGQAKIPLWERISEGMSELGYKRSAKRCKEKWENINKYFRRNKDNVNKKKKRSLDSRTCPYFHQLASLYTQRTLVQPSPGNRLAPATTVVTTALPENHPGSSQPAWF